MNRKTLIKLKKFILKIKNLSNMNLLEEYRKSNSNIDYSFETGFSNEIEYERNSILKEVILRRLNCYRPDFPEIQWRINREPIPTPAPPPKIYPNN